MSGFDAFDELVQESQSQQRVGGKFGSLGPAWTREIEKPQGSKDMGGWTANVYTQEQQTRLGVDADGKKPRSHRNQEGNPCNGTSNRRTTITRTSLDPK